MNTHLTLLQIPKILRLKHKIIEIQKIKSWVIIFKMLECWIFLYRYKYKRKEVKLIHMYIYIYYRYTYFKFLYD